jgi:hypothetical protein
MGTAANAQSTRLSIPTGRGFRLKIGKFRVRSSGRARIKWLRGPTDKAPDFYSDDCQFDSGRGHPKIFPKPGSKCDVEPAGELAATHRIFSRLAPGPRSEPVDPPNARLAEMADAPVLGTGSREGVRVRSSCWAPAVHRKSSRFASPSESRQGNPPRTSGDKPASDMDRVWRLLEMQ